MIIPRSKSRSAFTLIEILVVVVILGITSAIILPQLGTRDDLKTSSTAREIAADLLYVQNRSISMGKYHYVVFSTSSGKYDVMDSVSPQNIITHPVLHTPYEVLFGTGALQGCTLTTANFDGSAILAFDEMGVPYSYTAGTGATPLNAGSIVITSGAATITVTIQPYSGEIKVQ